MNNSSKNKSLDAKIISDYLLRIGYSIEAVKIYLALVKNGPLTLLNLSRSSGVERTRLYRLIDKLIKKGIVVDVPAYKRRTVKAISLEDIKLQVKEKMSQANLLQGDFGIFSLAVGHYANLNQSGVNVIYYHGVEGMKQMTWHVTNCKGLWRTYSYRFWNDIFGDKFTLDLNRELLDRRIKVRDLYSDQYIKYKENWMRSKGQKPAGDWRFWDARYISEKIVKINQNIDIYDDIVAYAYWDENDIFGVEIQNQRIADMQKQIHDVLWKMGKKIGHFDWANPVWKKS